MNHSNVNREKHILTTFLSFRDNIPTLRLAAWPLNAGLFDGETAAGPCPLLFGSDEEASLEALNRDPGKAHFDLMRIHRSFMAFEAISLKDAMSVVKKPR